MEPHLMPAASFMLHNYFIRFLEVGLFAVFILHIIQGLLLWKQNRGTRKISYAKQNFPREIRWYSRYMGWLGTFLLLFLVMHLYHFWASTKHELYFNGPVIDLYQEMKIIFTNPLLVYIVYDWAGLTFISFIAGVSKCISNIWNKSQEMDSYCKRNWCFLFVAICILFAMMPISFMAGWLQ